MALEKNKAPKLSLKTLEARIDALEALLLAHTSPIQSGVGKSINKVETFNGEKEIEQKENKMKMDINSKIQSAKNAVRILPPNMVVDGRHLAKNVSAICGFVVTEEMLDAVYAEKG